MLREQAVRTSLRAATAEAHERVDRIFSAFDLSRRHDYTLFLQAQAAALLPLEHALELGAGADLALDWSSRRRSAALRADLVTLGASVPEWAILPPITQPATALGTIYVLEGSRLGGALLKRSVPLDFPAAFLAPAPSARWREFLDVLETSLTTPTLRSDAIGAASHAFALFEQSGRSFAPRMN